MENGPLRPENDRTKEIVDRTRAARGYLYPAHAYLAQWDPTFLEDYNRLVGRAMQHDGFEGESVGTLPAKYRELIVIGILCFRGAEKESIAGHMKRALNAGVTRQELLAGLEAAMVPGGGTTLMNGLRVLLELDTRDDQQDYDS